MGPIRHTLRLLLGIGLLIVGIVGLILPVMPGWIFVIPGLLILGDYFPPIQRLVLWAKSRFKEAEQQYRARRGEAAEESPEEAGCASVAAENGEAVAGRPADSQQ